ncbi:hypothetical protein SteCoe_17353 [Stentor coeruleus]|uniref:Amino acid transporter transmembrane domain-containing protein n=1 Tax=Stentor coeruleus TaxID=5963 RepID=A0A1R2BZ82_9CILI|nr:hypothetical protein SteCoe_17353 [Stentor coeruleus]
MEKKPEQQENDFAATLFICINCSVAASIFGTPWAFVQVGWASALILSIIGVILLSLLGVVLIQVLTRMNVIKDYIGQGYTISHVPMTEIFRNMPKSNYIKTPNEISDNTPLLSTENHNDLFFSYELTLICRILLGGVMEKILSITIITTSTIFLMGCTSVFASSLVSVIPLGPMNTCNIFTDPSFENWCRYKYMVFVALFALITCTMTLFFHFTEQRWYLITVAFGRILAILLMAITSLIALGENQTLDDDESLKVDIEAFNREGVGIALPIIFLSMGFHIMIPELLEPLSNKAYSIKVIVLTFFIAFCMIILLCLTTIFCLNNVKPLITLNWATYSNGVDPSDRAWWAYIIDGYVSLFPAVDVTSVFAILLCNSAANLNALSYETIDNKNNTNDDNFKGKVFLLCLTLILPMYFYDIGILFALAGCVNLIVLMFFISILGLASVTIVPEKCVFDNFLANKKVLIGVTICSMLILIYLWFSFLGYFF